MKKLGSEDIIEEKDLVQDEQSEIGSSEDAMAMIEEMLADMVKVDIDTTEVDGTKIDKKTFEKGVKEVSKVAGIFSCLKSIGMSEDSIVAYILNERNIEHSQYMQDIINKGQLEMSKIQTINMESHQV